MVIPPALVTIRVTDTPLAVATTHATDNRLVVVIQLAMGMPLVAATVHVIYTTMQRQW